MKVEHLDVHKTMSDFEMFRSIKKRYYESKSATQRLLAMRGVKEIKFVKVGDAVSPYSGQVIIES